MIPKISIIVPAFNKQDYIKSALGSIKEQTYPNIETIVISNGSTDKTAEVSRKYTPYVYEMREKSI